MAINSQPKLYYVSMHGGEGWEEVTDNLKETLESIKKHWPKVPPKNLRESIYVFPLEARIKIDED